MARCYARSFRLGRLDVGSRLRAGSRIGRCCFPCQPGVGLCVFFGVVELVLRGVESLDVYGAFDGVGVVLGTVL